MPAGRFVGARAMIISAILSAGLAMAGIAGAQTPSSADIRSFSSRLGLIAFPTAGQNFEQQTKDEDACYKSGVQKTGQDPYQIVKTAKAKIGDTEQNIRAAESNSVKTKLGAIDGEATKDGEKLKKPEEITSADEARVREARQTAKGELEIFKKAFAQCLEGKKYSVKY